MSVTYHIRECDVTYSWVWRDIFVSVTWRIHECDTMRVSVLYYVAYEAATFINPPKYEVATFINPPKYEVASFSSPPKNIGFFCKRAL